MAKDYLKNGKRCRWYSYYHMWVSDDGSYVVVTDRNNKWNRATSKELNIWVDSTGRKFVDHPYGCIVSVAKAVITCFCPPYPQDGKSYVIGYKDGNFSNCNYKNLEWVPYHYNHASTASVVVRVSGLILTVNKDGSVENNGKKMTIGDSFFDADVDLEVCSSGPFITVPKKGCPNGNRVFIDELMKKAGFVQGDDADLCNPVILHKDNDYMNCDSDNLEWVEASDKRYQDFLQQKNVDTHDKLVKNNPGKDVSTSKRN